MRFELGQRFISARDPNINAEVIEVMGGGHDAWFEMRSANGEVLDQGGMNIVHIAGHWLMLAPGYGEQIEHGGYRIWVFVVGEGFQACTTRSDRSQIRAGVSLGTVIFTASYDRPDYALAAAKQAIDAQEVE
jgi:hypothetical protein